MEPRRREHRGLSSDPSRMLLEQSGQCHSASWSGVELWEGLGPAHVVTERALRSPQVLALSLQQGEAS